MILIDSDHLSVMLEHRDARRTQLISRIENSAVVAAIPIVVIEERLQSWLAQVRRTTDVNLQIVPYLRLAKVVDYLKNASVAHWNEPAAGEFKRLRKSGVRIGSQDLKIASIALANDALLLSANLRDFEQVLGLHVKDWLE